MAFKPTAEQELAINQNGSILVSAAAGSGKTAVLVERVVRLLTDRENPVSADKLLVVTFTNAAAAELRLRIDKRLGEEFEKNPDDPLLRRQKMLIHNAKFCTIDSFCINFIRENFEASGVSPSFKLADRATLAALERTAMSQVINECFEAEDKDFLSLLSFFGEDYDDSKLQSKIYQISRFSRHLPFPKLWFEKTVMSYKMHSTGESEEWFDRSIQFAKDLAVDANLNFKQALSLLEMNESAYNKYFLNYNFFYNTSEAIISMCEKGKWDKVFSILSDLTPPKCKNLSAEEKDANVTASVKLRDEGKKLLASLKTVVYGTKKDISDEISKMLPHITKLISLADKFEDRLNSTLAEKNLMTFSLAEQTAFGMLAEVVDGEIVASKAAQEYISLYDTVLVDEYQDTNSLQDTFFKILSNGGKNLFCVGDIKQSIYRFRGSNPLHFLSKKDLYFPIDTRGEDDGLRIDLGCNFRSRAEVCDDINRLFKKIVYKETSGFEYDEKEMLVPMAAYPQNNESKTEYHFIDFNSISEASDKEYDARISAEAEAVADIVLETVDKEPFLRDGDGLRKADYSDITILVRSMQSKGDIYIKALKERGIPVSVAASDIVGSDEARTLLSMLKVINNPSDDIALLTVMTSPVFAFSMNDLAKIRISHKYGNLISSVTAAAKNNDRKARSFLEVISRLRYDSIIMTVGQLIDEMFDTTNLLNIMSCGENGEVKRLNLLGILNFANRFESDGRRGLQAFLNYFSDIENQDFKLSASGSSNSVTVMSIHKSKGLQFPVCILANTSNQFNLADLRDRSIVSERDGFSTVYYDDGIKRENMILKTLMKNEEKKALLAEELRILYVALTRAEEKLIVMATYDNLKKEVLSKIEDINLTESVDRVDYALFRKNNSYADWILESLLIDGYGDALLSKAQAPNIIIHTDIVGISRETECKSFIADENAVRLLKQNYDFNYPYAELLELEAKASVTAIVHKADEDKYRFTSRPAFLQSSDLSSAEKGTAVHKVMQYIDLTVSIADIDDELERLYEHFYLTEEEYDAVDKDLILRFLESDLCRRVLNSQLVKREMKFLTEFSATELKGGLDKKFADEMIVVQGAVDLIFEEDGRLIIVDFKTDRNKDELELKAAYEEQLRMYAKACSKILRLPVGEMIIYSFSLEKEIKI